MKNFLLLLVGLGFIFWSFYVVLEKPAPEKYRGLVKEEFSTPLVVGDETLYVEVVDTPETRTEGLSNHEPLEPDQGMLFIFEEPAHYQFWMKDMLFSIDIVWISDEWLVAGIQRSVDPSTYPWKFSPSEPVRYVLEVNANSTIDIGDKVYLNR